MIERLATVRVKELRPLTDDSFPDCFVVTRRQYMQGTVDSPIYLNFNKHWLVKHITSGIVNGVSIGRYGIYHEDELEVIAAPTARTAEAYKPSSELPVYKDDDIGFDYTSWDDIPDSDE